MVGEPVFSSIWLPVISAASGLLGALIGGGATLLATKLTTSEAHHRARIEVLTAKGEELVALLCSAGEWFSVVEVSIPDTAKVMALWPMEPYRAQALTEAYFPSLAVQAAAIIEACTEYRQVLVNARDAVLKGERQEDVWDMERWRPAYEQLTTAAESLREAVLAEMHARTAP
jgi:hypothetical protein